MSAYYSPSILPQIRELMSQGKTPTQIAASLHISKQDLIDWLSNPEPLYDELRREVEVGMTAAEAYWEEKGQLAIEGKIRFFRETTYKLFMENRFKWNTEKPDTPIKSPEQMLTDDILDDKIKKHIEAYNDISRLAQAPDGERAADNL
jgi:hypothetical protein